MFHFQTLGRRRPFGLSGHSLSKTHRSCSWANVFRGLVAMATLGSCFGQSCNVLPLLMPETQVLDYRAERPPEGTQDQNQTGTGDAPVTDDNLSDNQSAGDYEISAIEGEEIVLDGTAFASISSKEPKYLWQQTDGPVVELFDASTAVARFIAPPVEADTTLTFVLTVSSGTASTTATVRALIQNSSEQPNVQVEISASIVEGDAPLTVDLAAVASGGIELPDGVYVWDFGDGSTAEGPTVRHVFNTASIYTVALCATLTGVSTQTGCTEKEITVLSTDDTARNHKRFYDVSQTYVISGRLSVDGAGVAGAVVSGTNGGGTAVTDSAGQYRLTVLRNWSGDVAPQTAGYSYTPGKRSYSLVKANLSGQDFSANPASVANVVPVITQGASTTLSLQANTAATQQLSATDTDASSSTLAWTITTAAQHGSASVSAGSPSSSGGSVTVSYQPAADYAGTDSFNAQVNDGQGGTDTITVNVTVTAPATQPPPPPTGQVLYVATTGSDSAAGTQAAPFATIGKAAAVAQPGTTILVAGGVYNQQVQLGTQGTAAAPIVIKNVAGARPIVDGQGTRSYGFFIENAKYLTIDGFEIRNVKYNAVCIQDSASTAAGSSTFITIKNTRVHDCGRTGIYVRGGDDCTVSYCEAFNCLIGIQVQWRDTTANKADRATITHNLAHDNTGDRSAGALEESDNIAVSGANAAVVEYNLCWNSGDDGIDVSSSSSMQDLPMNCVIRFNAVWKSGYLGAPGDGSGIKSATNAGGGHVIHHNIAFLNTTDGFNNDQEGNYGANQFYNNTAYRNGAIGLYLDMAGVTSANSAAIAKNNLLYRSGEKDFKASGTYAIQQSDYNLIGDGQKPSAEGSHSLTGDPKLANPDAAININYAGSDDLAQQWQFVWDQIASNFALRSDSPCLTTGLSIQGITDAGALFVGAWGQP